MFALRSGVLGRFARLHGRAVAPAGLRRARLIFRRQCGLRLVDIEQEGVVVLIRPQHDPIMQGPIKARLKHRVSCTQLLNFRMSVIELFVHARHDAVYLSQEGLDPG